MNSSINTQVVDEPTRAKRPAYSTSSSLFERSDDKHDIARYKIGPLRLVANYQHPPIDRKTQIHTVFIVTASIVFAFMTPLLLRFWYWNNRVSLWGSLLTSSNIWLILIVPPVVHGWWKFGGQRREKRLMRELSAAQSPLTDARIEIRGRPSELLRFTELRDEMFEPIVFQETHSMLGMSLQLRLILSMSVIFFASYILMRNGFQRHWWVGVTLIGIAYFILRGIPCPHKYYRFVPGRVDFFVYPWLRSIRPTKAAQFDLRGAHIRIDLTSRKEMILIAPPGDDLDNPLKRTQHLLFRRDNTPSPLEFSIALVRAALCTATPPPLPMDALTG